MTRYQRRPNGNGNEPPVANVDDPSVRISTTDSISRRVGYVSRLYSSLSELYSILTLWISPVPVGSVRLPQDHFGYLRMSPVTSGSLWIPV
jgi:hypothetical protein